MPDRRTRCESGDFDCVLVGGGLQNALVALALLARRPAARIALVERGETIGGNHRWSFHAGDVPPAAGDFFAPLIETRWPAYAVRFPGFARVLELPYGSFDSRRLHAVVERAFAQAPASALLTGCSAESVDGESVTLQDGRRLSAPLIVDARGPERFASGAGAGIAGYQKFVGLELELSSPSHAVRPCVMDADVPQDDGFRFFYVLPLTPRRVLVEDTRFSDSPALDRDAGRQAALAYATGQGLAPLRIAREEHGVLPLPSRLPPASAGDGPLAAGYQGGWFHPTTGYSLPAAVRLADRIAAADGGELASPAHRAALRSLARAHRDQTRFFVALNRMLFRWFAPPERWHVLERFYRLPEAVIARFYGMTTTRADRARIVCGRPPRGLSLGRLVTQGLSA